MTFFLGKHGLLMGNFYSGSSRGIKDAWEKASQPNQAKMVREVKFYEEKISGKSNKAKI